MFDSDIGFLPGDEQKKISPLMRPIMDNLEQLVDSSDSERLNFIRGRSIIKTYLIIDEAQNMTPAQIKGIITRAGKETKIIIPCNGCNSMSVKRCCGEEIGNN